MRAWVAVLRWIIVKRLSGALCAQRLRMGQCCHAGFMCWGKNVRARGVCRQRQPVAKRACDGFINKL